MSNADTLIKVIDSLNGEFTQKWIDVCNIESPTYHKSGLDAVGEYFADYAVRNGWQVERFDQKVAGNVITITLNPTVNERPITFSGHIDTVHSLGSFGTPAVKCDDTRIYGPGVMDCKGGCVAALLAIKALHECGFNKRPVRLILQTDEECNSSPSGKETIRYICNSSRDSIAFLNCESVRGNTAVLWRKGIARYRLEIKGKSIHASRCAEGASAICEAAAKILEFERYKDENGITCCCGRISGGESDNTVPEKCVLSAEFRFNTVSEIAVVEEITKAISEKCYVEGTECVTVQTALRPPMESSEKNQALFNRINQIYEDCGLPKLTARKSLGGSDAADVTAYGIPCIDSIGVAGDFIHTKEEYAEISSLAESAKRLALVAYFI